MATIAIFMDLPDADIDQGWDGDTSELEGSIRARLEGGIYGDDGGEYLPTVLSIDVQRPENLQGVTGYRTNHDGTETLAWLPNEHGTVECVHAAPACCQACVDADSRLRRDPDSGDVVIGHWPTGATREGRTVRFGD